MDASPPALHAQPAATTPAAVPSVELACSGYPVLALQGRPVGLKLRRGLALLVHLSEIGRKVARSRLAELLWPDAPEDTGRGRLRRLCHEVNGTVGIELLAGDADAVWLATAHALDTDVQRVRRAAMQLMTAADAPESRLSLERLCDPAAVQILAGFDSGSDRFDAWVAERRAELERLVARALARSAEQLLASGQPVLAAEAAAALVRLDPLADAGHALTLHARSQLGDAAGVEAAYFACAELLRGELGIRPSPHIEAAYAQSRERLAHPADDEAPAAIALPPIRYADADDGAVAYLELGRRDAPGGTLVVLFGLWSHLEVAWDQPVIRATLDRLARRFHVVLMDRRGVGLSDRQTPSITAGVQDLEAVRQALGVERLWLFANSAGGAIAIEHAVTHAPHVRGLLLFATGARGSWAPDYPWALTLPQLEAWLQKLQSSWGRATSLEQFAPSVAHDATARDWWARLLRQSASRNSVPALLRTFADMDVRERLPNVRVPTLVVQRAGDRIVRAAAGRHLADGIAGARFVLLPGDDNLMWFGDTEAVIREVERFVDEAED
jgi:pimeloyl-ACP methyl ester carboxylesterase/DNA-binding SARP family transcriptional activator